MDYVLETLQYGFSSQIRCKTLYPVVSIMARGSPRVKMDFFTPRGVETGLGASDWSSIYEVTRAEAGLGT